MGISFDKTGAGRKALVTAISEITGIKAKYMGAPGFVYRVGGYTISKDGMLETGEAADSDVSSLLAALEARGFAPAEKTELSGDADEAAPTPIITAEDDYDGVLTIEWPAEEYTDRVRDNLEKLVDSKAVLIRKAIGVRLGKGTDHLPVYENNGRICFSWFRAGMNPGEIDAWSKFTGALIETAKKQKRVILKEKPLDEGASEKFAMRCFLLKLGFIGDAYKDARRIILAEMSGDGSRKMPKDRAIIQDGEGAVIVCGENSGREAAI